MAALWKTVSTPLSRLCLPLSASLVSESTVAHGLRQTEDCMLSCLLVACVGCGATCFCFLASVTPASTIRCLRLHVVCWLRARIICSSGTRSGAY
jgi:hypothetical protein